MNVLVFLMPANWRIIVLFSRQISGDDPEAVECSEAQRDSPEQSVASPDFTSSLAGCAGAAC